MLPHGKWCVNTVQKTIHSQCRTAIMPVPAKMPHVWCVHTHVHLFMCWLNHSQYCLQTQKLSELLKNTSDLEAHRNAALHKLSELQVLISSCLSFDAISVAMKHVGNAASVLKAICDEESSSPIGQKAASIHCFTGKANTVSLHKKEKRNLQTSLSQANFWSIIAQ